VVSNLEGSWHRGYVISGIAAAKCFPASTSSPHMGRFNWCNLGYCCYGPL